MKGWQLSPRALIHPPVSIHQQQQPFMQQQQCLQPMKQHQNPLQQQLELSLHQQQTPLQKVQQHRTPQQQQSKPSLHKPLTLNPFDFSTSSLSNRQQPTAQTDLSQQQQLSPSPQLQQQQWTPHRSVELHHQMYKAIYDFNATQPDELRYRNQIINLIMGGGVRVKHSLQRF